MNAATTSIKVLVICVEGKIPTVNIQSLSLKNIECTLCKHSPKDLTEGLRSRDFDLVILEHYKAYEDKFSVLNFFKTHENKKTRQIPIIAITGVSEITKIIEIYEMGAVDVFLKWSAGDNRTEQEVLCAKIKAQVRVRRGFE